METLLNRWPNFFSGKKMGAKDLKEIYQFIIALTADLAATMQGPDDFGLIYSRNIPFELNLNGNRLELKNMMGITPNGMLIMQHENYCQPIYEDLPVAPKAIKQDVSVVVSYDTTPMRSLSPAEPEMEPLKYCLPNYLLEINNQPINLQEEFNNRLKIGELFYEDGEYVLGEYIPPCRHLGAHKVLWNKFLKYKKHWNDFVKYSPQIMAHSLASASYSDQSDLYRLAEAIGKYLIDKNALFQDLCERSKPRELFLFVSGLAQTFFMQLEITRYTQRRSEMLDLFRKVTHSTPAYIFERQGFLDAVEILANPENKSTGKYYHQDLASSMSLIECFWKHTTKVWHRLREPLPYLSRNEGIPVLD
ncbi:MAG: hypothetical protein AAFZ15_31945 [Bacteroidota bacterium]